MTFQGQLHVTTNILVDGKVERVRIKPAELELLFPTNKQMHKNLDPLQRGQPAQKDPRTRAAVAASTQF